MKNYIVVKAEVITGYFDKFEDDVNQKMKEGYTPLGGIDVKTTSADGWLLSQAMVLAPKKKSQGKTIKEGKK